MTTPGRRISVWGIVAVASGVAIVLAVGVAISSMPSVCARCHQRQAAALASTSHDGVSCYGCHLPAGPWSFAEAKTDEFFAMYPAQILGRGMRGPGDRVSRGRCARCHADAMSGVSGTGSFYIQHEKCAAPPAKCDGCHSGSAHPGALRWPRELDMDACTGCHSERGAPLNCEACHRGEVPTDTLAAGGLSVTHGRDWERTHGMADLRTCVTCHERAACVRCHGTPIPHPDSFLASHGRQALARGARCSVCHPDQVMCKSCHGLDMPHPKDFRQRHTTTAKTRDDPACLRCHKETDCVNCHARHVHPAVTDGSLNKTPLPKTKASP